MKTLAVAHGGAADMKERRAEVELVDGLVAQIIGEAALAGAYASLIRLMPETAGGFGKLADKHSRRVKALAEEISAGARRIDAASATAR